MWLLLWLCSFSLLSSSSFIVRGMGLSGLCLRKESLLRPCQSFLRLFRGQTMFTPIPTIDMQDGNIILVLIIPPTVIGGGVLVVAVREVLVVTRVVWHNHDIIGNILLPQDMRMRVTNLSQNVLDLITQGALGLGKQGNDSDIGRKMMMMMIHCGGGGITSINTTSITANTTTTTGCRGVDETILLVL